ncbi:ABC transporter permease [Paenibacillus sp. N1-5-1-14]|uniref:ABC transporter permease n=1 Tax=Paenibacillus radicibacter TaxID=2972488 RepID=UPI0021598A34|nr:ABC transporter permease [Paenibacillus radicibacter]MCR8643976.1 ABC transporter permease [Paenibacillus radicibacter]
MIQRLGRTLTELGILFKIQFSIIREAWVFVFLLASIFPFTMLLFMKFFTINPTPEFMVRMIVGNMVFGLIVMGINSMGQDLSWQKHQGHFTFYASLPISKINFVIACLLRGLMTTLPSFIIIALIGQFVFDIHFNYSFAIIPVVLLALFSVVGIGVGLGFWSPNHHMTSMLTQVFMMLITFLTPVMVDMNQLPITFQWVSYIFPTTYATQALLDIFTIGWTPALTQNAFMMVGFSILTYMMIMKNVKWRVNK